MNWVPLKPQRMFGFHFARTAAAPKLTGGKGCEPAEQFSMDGAVIKRQLQQQALWGFSININSGCQFLA